MPARSIDGGLLLEAIDQLLSDPAVLEEEARATFDAISEAENTPGSETDRRECAIDRIIEEAASSSALSGGLTALAGVIPGLGTVLATFGATTANLALTLKFQIEMILRIAHLHGFDLHREKTRQLAFLLAGLALIEPGTAGSPAPFARARQSRDPFSHLSRQLLQELFQHVARVLARRAAGRLLPFGIGVVIGYRTNRRLCLETGKRAREHFASCL